MHRHRTAAGPAPASGSTAFRVQRKVLLELVTAPPPEGDRPDVLAARLDEHLSDVLVALAALRALGLATEKRGAFRATPAALRFDALDLIRA